MCSPQASVKAHWRKGHQWVALTRAHASLVSSNAWYDAFWRAHARTDVAKEFRAGWETGDSCSPFSREALP